MTFFESIFYMAWRGIAIGLIISAPMGPVGMLCIQRTLDKGRRAGLYTGIGAAISDLFYSLLTGFGLSFIEDFMERNQNIIQLVGSFVLIGFGIYLFRNNPSKGLRKPADEDISPRKNILTGFFFTVSNPLILFLIIGLFARFNFILPAEPQNQLGIHIIQYIIGFAFIYAGAIIWWWFITFSIDKVRSHFNIRSMWLINKIIGIIILLFAVVGIFTATTALVQGADIRCFNSVRGYEPFAEELCNPTPDTLFFLAPCGRADAVEFRCKVKNRKPAGNLGFVMTGKGGQNGGEDERIFIDIRAIETDTDGISSSPALEVAARGSCQTSTKAFADNSGLLKRIKSGMSGPDPTGAQNFFKIVVYDDLLTLFGGLHSPQSLLTVVLPHDFIADSIGFYLTPGAQVEMQDIRLTTDSFRSYGSLWEDSDKLKEYLSQSSDLLEGYWQILDRSLDEGMLRLGGDYRYALVKSEAGYDLLYLSGAKVNASKWTPGMLKAKFRPSGIRDVWNVEWYDSMHKPLSHELKAQADQNGVITIQFPYQNSQIRLFNSESE